MMIINRYSEINAPLNKVDGTLCDNPISSAPKEEADHKELSQTAGPEEANLDLHSDNLTDPPPERHLKVVEQNKVVADVRKFHPVANIFPLMARQEFDDLKADIAKNGLLEPIWLDKYGLIVDGRNRYLACLELGITPQYRTYEGDDPLAFVVSANLKRRHLSQLQKSIIALDLIPLLAKEAKERMLKGKGNDGSGGRGRRKEVEPVTENEAMLEISEDRNPQAKIPEGLAKQTRTDNESRTQAAKMVGTNPRYVTYVKKIATNAPDVIEAAKAGKISSIPDANRLADLAEPLRTKALKMVDEGSKLSEAINKTVSETIRGELEAVEATALKAIEGVYDVIVVDPPWAMKGVPYSTMSLDEIRALEIPCCNDSHVFVWANQKFLPDAFDIIKAWGLEYVCTFVWHKPCGPQPVGLPQYNCEFVLYCTKGSPKFVDTKDFWTCFNAPRGGHSEKPEEFYDVIRRVTGGTRIDMFNRRKIEGFETWGDEAEKYPSKNKLAA